VQVTTSAQDTMTPLILARSYDEYRTLEVEWYREHGKFPKRIVMGRHGEYVIGDQSWNKYPWSFEPIEESMFLGVESMLWNLRSIET